MLALESLGWELSTQEEVNHELLLYTLADIELRDDLVVIDLSRGEVEPYVNIARSIAKLGIYTTLSGSFKDQEPVSLLKGGDKHDEKMGWQWCQGNKQETSNHHFHIDLACILVMCKWFYDRCHGNTSMGSNHMVSHRR